MVVSESKERKVRVISVDCESPYDHSRYEVESIPPSITPDSGAIVYADIKFRYSSLVDGCNEVDLLRIILDRLKYESTKEMALAAEKINEAIHWMNHRKYDKEK